MKGGSLTPPEQYLSFREQWRALHPDYEVREWTLPLALSFLKKHYPKYLPLFLNYKREIYRIDAIRYFLLHHYGGFYVDSDIEPYQNIDRLTQYQVVLALNQYTKDKARIYNNHFMGAQAQSPFFKRCLSALPYTSFLQSTKPSYSSTMMVAGPFYLTALANHYRKEITVLSFKEERMLFYHHEKHSWKMSKSILNDLLKGMTLSTALLSLKFLRGRWPCQR